MFRNNKRAVRFPARSSRAVHFDPVAISSSEKLLIPPKTKIVASLCVVVIIPAMIITINMIIILN